MYISDIFNNKVPLYIDERQSREVKRDIIHDPEATAAQLNVKKSYKRVKKKKDLGCMDRWMDGKT